MTTDPNKRDQLLHAAIRRALNEEWDPIGMRTIARVFNFDPIEDEYDNYVPEIYDLLIAQKSRQEIFDYLWWLETEWMGLGGNRQATENFADRLLLIAGEVDAGLYRMPGTSLQ